MNSVLGLAILLLSALPVSAAEGGKGVYDAKCASCHGKDAKGNPAMAKMFKVEPDAMNLVNEAALAKTDEELAKIVSAGKGKMPAYEGKLKPEEIKEVIAYLRSAVSGKAEEKAKAGKAVDAAPLYKKNCAACHGADAKGNPAMAKMFKVEPGALDLVDEATLAKSDEEIAKMLTAGKGKMPAFKAKLTGDEIKALINFLRSSAAAKKEQQKP